MWSLMNTLLFSASLVLTCYISFTVYKIYRLHSVWGISLGASLFYVRHSICYAYNEKVRQLKEWFVRLKKRFFSSDDDAFVKRDSPLEPKKSNGKRTMMRPSQRFS